jgi:pyruvate decarboxylase
VSKLPRAPPLELPTPPTKEDPGVEDDRITQSWLWPRIGNFLRSGDTLFADGGTTHFGLADADYPDITYVMQNHWASIGYATPAAFGAAMARKDMAMQDVNKDNRGEQISKGRMVLITGEGALQLTVQEVGTIVREKLDMIM